MKVQNYKFMLLAVLIVVVCLSLYGIFSYILVIKVQNEVFLSTINQSIVQINSRLKDLESTVKPGRPHHPRGPKRAYREKRKNIPAQP